MHLNQFYYGNKNQKDFGYKNLWGISLGISRFRNNLNAGITNTEMSSALQNPSTRSGKSPRTKN